jgi:hypothetical protein
VAGHHAGNGKTKRSQRRDARGRFVKAERASPAAVVEQQHPGAEEPSPPGPRLREPVTAREVWRVVTAVGALVVLGLTAMVLAQPPRTPTIEPSLGSSATVAPLSPATSASVTSSEPPPASVGSIASAEGLAFRGSSSESSPLQLEPGPYVASWQARSIASRCDFSAVLRPVVGGTVELVPAASAPRGTTVSGSGEYVLEGGRYDLEVNVTGCRWRLTLENGPTEG